MRPPVGLNLYKLLQNGTTSLVRSQLKLKLNNRIYWRNLCTDHTSDSSESDSDSSTMELKTVVSRLNKFAPTSLAASWDNVGLLVEPTPPHVIDTLLLTNDLTEAVTAEALEKKASMILSYHPPIFVPLKRLTQATWKERVIVKCIENRIAVYSPHTAYDALDGGVNDWLLQPFGKSYIRDGYIHTILL